MKRIITKSSDEYVLIFKCKNCNGIFWSQTLLTTQRKVANLNCSYCVMCGSDQTVQLTEEEYIDFIKVEGDE